PVARTVGPAGHARAQVAHLALDRPGVHVHHRRMVRGRCHPAAVARPMADGRTPARYPARMTSGDRIRYLSATDVAAAMPPIPAQLDLAEQTLRALDGGSDLPAKIGVHPRPAASFGHAMPAWLRGVRPDEDLLGIKWVTGFPANRELGR